MRGVCMMGDVCNNNNNNNNNNNHKYYYVIIIILLLLLFMQNISQQHTGNWPSFLVWGGGSICLWIKLSMDWDPDASDCAIYKIKGALKTSCMKYE
jgi:hypothetical protein